MEQLKELESKLPEFLKSDIENYINAWNTDSLDLDCWWGEVYGSINMALSSLMITEEEAQILRNHYLFGKEQNG